MRYILRVLEPLAGVPLERANFSSVEPELHKVSEVTGEIQFNRK